MTSPYPIRPIDESEYAAFGAVPEEAFNSRYPREEMLELDRAVMEFDRTAAAFDGDQIVGTSLAFTYRMAVPGGTYADTGGVSAVSVLPAYRRRGILTGMMTRLLDDIAGRGEPLAALFASEPEIYGRYGFGAATEHLNLTIARADGALREVAGPRPRLRVAEPDKIAAELAAVYTAMSTRRPGMLARDDRWWQVTFADPEWAREGTTPTRWMIAEDDSGPRGYASYSVKPDWDADSLPDGQLHVHELIGLDPAATAALWADLLSRDLVSKIRAFKRPVDEPLLQLLAGRRRARASLVDGLWVRLVDVPAALALRRYARGVDVVLDVTDAALPANAGRWRLSAAPDSPATCERTSRAADVALDVAALGAVYLGGTRLTALAAADQVGEIRPGTLAQLSAALAWDPAPWSPMGF
jgi:predicted acetyltransferase